MTYPEIDELEQDINKMEDHNLNPVLRLIAINKLSLPRDCKTAGHPMVEVRKF